MYLFSRVATPKGLPREVIEFATEVTDYVNRKVETNTTLWQGMFGGPLGTLAWNTLVKGRAHVGQVMMTLMGDDDYHEHLERGSEFWSDLVPTQDYLSKFVFGDPNQSPAEIGAVGEMITAVPAAGRIADAMAWGPQIAQLVGRTIGTTPSFWASAYGPFGEVSWITIHPSLEALDEATDALMSSEEYVTEVVKAGELFVEGSGQRSAAMRIH